MKWTWRETIQDWTRKERRQTFVWLIDCWRLWRHFVLCLFAAETGFDQGASLSLSEQSDFFVGVERWDFSWNWTHARYKLWIMQRTNGPVQDNETERNNWRVKGHFSHQIFNAQKSKVTERNGIRVIQSAHENEWGNEIWWIMWSD